MNINECMATEVMGWHEFDGWWCSTETDPITLAKKRHYEVRGRDRWWLWQPTNRIDQAMMCAEKLDEEFIDYEILVSRYEKVVRIWAPSKNKWFRKCWETLDELPLAICEAVKEATK